LRSLLCGLAACLMLLGALAVAAPSPASAASTPMTALVLASTVAPNTATDSGAPDNDPASLEEQQAENDGYTVTSVSDSTWENMTEAQFASYQLIILGNPGLGNCTNTVGTDSVAYSNASTWEPAVMSSGGNKVLIGTDPTLHYVDGTAPDAPELEKNSLAYAGAVSGATGVYLDLNCAYDYAPSGTTVPILSGLTSQGATGQFAVEGYDSPTLHPLNGGTGACETDVNIVASTGPTSGLTDADLAPWNCSVHEAFTSFPSDYTPLVLAPTSSGFPSSYCADDVQTGEEACGSPYILVSGGGVSVSSNILLSPSSQDAATSPGSPGSATVTATVTSGGSPESGKQVTFTVTSGPDAGQTAQAITDDNGQANFAIDNSGVAGSDSVSASFTDDQGDVEQALATVTFQGPDQVSATSQDLSGTENTSLGDPQVATFTDPSGEIGASGWTAQINWGDGTADAPGTVSATGTANQYAVNADHTYAAPGVYTVTVTITDAGNSADTTTVTSTATVSQGQLSVDAQSFTATEGSSFSGEVASFTNTDTSTTAGSYTATIDWGDGTADASGTVTADSGSPGSFTVNASHTYAEDGSYTVTVTITGGDNPDTTASDTSTATVQPTAINLTADNINPAANVAFTGTVATFTDADTLPGASFYTATINWGDGNTSPGTITGSDGSFTVTGNHTYAMPGTFTLTVTVQEANNPTTATTSTATATVADTTLTVTGRGTLLLPSETLNQAVASMHYGTPAAPASSFHATISWGDGAISPGTVTGSAGSYSVSGTHTYAGAGPYLVTVTVTDPAGRKGTAQTTVMVPSTISAMSMPGAISAKKLLCRKSLHKCTGLTILGTFRAAGTTVWTMSLSKSGKNSVSLDQITRKVSAGSARLLFRVTNAKLAKRLYKLVEKHRLNMLTVQQTFTNAAGAGSKTTLFSRVSR
jgi:PKD repeat protein